MTNFVHLRASDYRRVRWKNDGGWTTEIARDPEGDGDFRWRISIADIESDGPFSTFPGVTRDLVLLAGNGIELDIGDAPTQRLTERFQRVRFEGEANVDCRLIAGPTRDFNVMARRDAVRADVVARPLVGSMVLFGEAHVVWIVHALSGHAQARAGDASVALASGDTLRIAFDDDSSGRVVIDGGGEIVLVKLAPA